MSTESTQPPKPSSFRGVDHLKLASFSIEKTHEFYTKILPFTSQPQWDHFTPEHKLFAKIVKHESTNLILEIRYEPTQAEAQRGWDPITWGVGCRKDLEEWERWLDFWKVKHSRILVGIKSWVMAFEYPDGKFVRLFVQDDEHELTDHPDRDQYWLGKIKADPTSG
jgi:hypothetical protein